MSCSVEIRKGNLEFLAPILGDTHSCSMVLFHHSCLAGAARGSPPATCAISARSFLPTDLWKDTVCPPRTRLSWGESGDELACCRWSADKVLKYSFATSSVLGKTQEIISSWITSPSRIPSSRGPASSLPDTAEDLPVCWSPLYWGQLPTHPAGAKVQRLYL